MANGHWSQFSHRPKFFVVSPLVAVVTLILCLASQKFLWLLWIVFFMWVYIAVFQFWLKMPLNYTSDLIRVWLTGRSKKIKNFKDGLEL